MYNTKPEIIGIYNNGLRGGGGGSGSGTTITVPLPDADLAYAGVVITGNTTNDELTSANVNVVPTQWFMQQEIARLDDRIDSGGGGTGTVTGIAANVAGGTATISATGSTTSVKLTGTGGVDVKGNTTTGDVELDISNLSDGTQSITKDLENARFVEANPWSNSTPQNALTLLHLSDIHADATTLARIVADATSLAPDINGMICTGDLVVGYESGPIADWWIPSVMTVIGNHDASDSSGNWTALSMATRDAYYIAPFESNWGITHTSGTSYYYKDFTTQKVRLIVLDCVLYNANPTGTTVAEAEAQTAWLENLLADAITNDLHVLIAAHSAYSGAVSVPCSFSKFNQQPQSLIAKTQTPLIVISAVANAIKAGLTFIGYIVGHYHQDGVWDALGDGTQLMYAVTCAAITPASQWSKYSDMFRSTELDAYNLVTIDTTNKRLKIVRGGGANIDCRMRKRESISVNYETNEVIDYETVGGDATRYTAVTPVAGSSVTLRAGMAYQILATSDITVDVEAMPSASYGRNGMLDITLSGGTVVAGNNVIFADTLTADSRNICAVHFIDGIAVINVLTVVAVPVPSYTVTITSGTTDGSLYYGLASNMATMIQFDPSTDGQTINANGAITNGTKRIMGNSVTSTIITGGVSAGSRFTELNSVALSGASQYIAFYTHGGSAYLNNVLFESNTISGTTYNDASFSQRGGEATITGCTFSHNSAFAPGYGAGYHGWDGAKATLQDCLFTGNLTDNDGGALAMNIAGVEVSISGCTFSDNATNSSAVGANGGGAGIYGSGSTTIQSCLFTSNTALKGGALAIFNSALSAQVTGCTFADNAGYYGGAFYMGSVVSAVISDCVFSGNSNRIEDTTNGLADSLFTSQCNSVQVVGCTFTGGHGRTAALGFANILADQHALVSDCTVTNNAGTYPVTIRGGSTTLIGNNFSSNNNTYDLGVTASASVTASNGNTIEKVFLTSGSVLTFVDSNNIGKITKGTDATVLISSGASISLSSSIVMAANGIVVSSGGCVVNGATIAEGTYTQIVSSGGSAVAS